MADLTDLKPDCILLCLDATALTAVQNEVNKWSTEDKAKVTFDGSYVFMPPDPLGTMDAKRKTLLGLVDKDAEDMTSEVRVRFNGPEFSFIVGQLNKPPEI